jgi:hypothetical protein
MQLAADQEHYQAVNSPSGSKNSPKDQTNKRQYQENGISEPEKGQRRNGRRMNIGRQITQQQADEAECSGQFKGAC